jgi:fructokinase
MSGLFGAIEAGGTKFNCIVAGGPDDIHDEIRISTTYPEETLNKVTTFFSPYCASGSGENENFPMLQGIGIACFGPLDLDPSSKDFGSITGTTKDGWNNTPISRIVERATGVPVNIDTDVNAAAIGESVWGAAVDIGDIIYITIGTGIGGGGLINGLAMHGLVHPEMGHIRIPHDINLDPFPGICPYHGDCFEGLASGPAIKERWGIPAEDLPETHPAWGLEAQYIALALQSYITTVSPKRIILGGGVMQKEYLFPMIHTNVIRLLNGYVQSPALLEEIGKYIVSPGLGSRSGVMGALALAMGMDKKTVRSYCSA